ncbi:hypothetical protein ACSV5M_13160 [Cellvibrio sp. ARAG 10.3]|uniref:hypothetical protein n=1 Tax=Cellvibrio sp. ARAG 10.3 TaxID=3451358 RepID=UPI003F45ABD4
MFFHQRIFKGAFNRYYFIEIPSHGIVSGWNTRRVDVYGRAKSFVQQLDVSSSYWRELLHTQSHIDLRHVQQTGEELVAELLHSGRINAYEVPGPEEIKQLASCTVTDKKTGVGYMFLSQNAPLVMNITHRRAFNSTREAEGFLKMAALDEKQINTLLSCLKDQPPSRLSAHQRLVLALMNGTLMVSVTPSSSPAKPKEIQREDVAHAAQPVSLGPHAEPGYVPPDTKVASPLVAVAQANQPAQSLEECEQRLAAARERLKSQGYQPKYTDQELLALADKGELDDRFIVRFTESKYAGDTAYLGRQDADGSVKFWSTTFNQLENADTDPQTICAVLGIPNYDPAKTYSLVVVDIQAAGAGQSISIVPTHKKLGEFANKEVKGLDPERVNEVMTPEYNKVYAEHMAQFSADKLDIKNDKDIRDYADGVFTSDKDKDQFETRTNIHRKLGANECFRGDGTTENLLPNKQQCGVMETFTYDKNPQTLSALENSNSAKRIAAKPLRKIL